MTTTESNLSSDAIEVLTSDHREVEALFSRIETGTAGQRDEAIDEVIRELSIHAVIEEKILYPAVRKELPGGDELADHSIEEHQEVKETLSALEKKDALDADKKELLRTLMTSVREHVEEEEQELFPMLRAQLSPDQLREMGAALTKAKKMAPTRPHPKAPNTPPGNIVAGAAASVADRVRDAVGGSKS